MTIYKYSILVEWYLAIELTKIYKYILNLVPS